MIRLTKELVAFGNLLVTTGVETQELDFNLARRSGVVINHIDSQIQEMVGTGDILDECVQELDLDPDNTNIWQNGLGADITNMDTSRLLRHITTFASRDGTAEAIGDFSSHLSIDFRMLPIQERPLSITNLRHHLWNNQAVGSGAIVGLLVIRYIIVELTLEELGIVNAGRR